MCGITGFIDFKTNYSGAIFVVKGHVITSQCKTPFKEGLPF
jgi:hypothetical protein